MLKPVRRNQKTRYILAYDISDDGRRTRLAHFLQDYGERVQKSVFEADLSLREVKEILTRAANYIDVGDSFRMYPTCATCAAGVKWLGRDVSVEVVELKIV